MTVGEKIRKYRTKRGLSQKELAIKCKMSEPAIRNYELGNRKPNEKQRMIIAAALEINVLSISNPTFESYHGVMHALYFLEESYGFEIIKDGSGVSLVCNDIDFLPRLLDWGDIYNDYKAGKISEEEYEEWKDSYPEKAIYNKKNMGK